MTHRELIWSWLVVHPGRTAFEIARAALGRSGPTSGSVHAGNVRQLLIRMERAGQVTRGSEYRAQQGKDVSLWYAVPGALAIQGGDQR